MCSKASSLPARTSATSRSSLASRSSRGERTGRAGLGTADASIQPLCGPPRPDAMVTGSHAWNGARGAELAGYAAQMPHFRYDGQRIAYTEYGEGPRPIVLIHGLLLSQRMHAPLAQALAERGNRVVTIDL